MAEAMESQALAAQSEVGGMDLTLSGNVRIVRPTASAPMYWRRASAS